MKKARVLTFLFVGSVILLLGFLPLRGESRPYWARLGFYVQAAQIGQSGEENDIFSEMVATLALRSAEAKEGGFEYALDSRIAGYPSSERKGQRVSIYDAYLGWRFLKGAFGVRAGQVWLNELGALGSLGGIVVEARPLKQLPFGLGELRLGAFGGLEPKIMEAGYVSGIKKFGGYLTINGQGARRHVLGYVNIQNQGLTERSVVVFNNFIPVNRAFFLYQAAEYDLKGPAGNGSGRLAYFFTNLRYSPWRMLELQGLYHRGRSIDYRSIIDRQINGRPIDDQLLEGFLFESMGGRVTLRLFPGFQVFAGYAQDRTNEKDEARNRLNLGLFANNVFKSGFDFRLSDTRFSGGSGSSYDSWYLSLGRTFGRSVYLEGFYSSSVSVFRLSEQGIVIERRPQTKRFGLSSVIHLLRSASLLLTIERTQDEASSENRLLTGLSYRF